MRKDITFLIPSLSGGGVEKVTFLMVNELAKRGWEVTLMISRLGGPYLEKLQPQIKICKLKSERISANLFEIAKYLKKEKPSIFFSSMMYVNCVAALAAKISSFKGKLILSERSHPSTSMLTNVNISKKVILGLSKLVYPRADIVVCVSNGVKEDLQTLIKNLKKVVVQHNPIENMHTNTFIKTRTHYRLLSAGRLDKEKNFILLIRAFAEIAKKLPLEKGIELYILGEGQERGNLEAAIKEYNLTDQVHLPGFVDQPGSYYQDSDLFVFTSNREGLGNAIIEALSFGLPVISTDCPSGPAEILLDGKIGKLVPVNDLEKLTSAIEEEINNPDITSTKLQRIERAHDFSLDKVMDRYESLFLS